jgi:acetyl esterase
MALAPEYQAMFDQLAKNGPAPGISDLPVPDGRSVYRSMRPVNSELPVHKIEDFNIEGPLGEIPVRVYGPAGDGPFGVLVYFHGGGWVIGDIDTADAVCRELSTLAELVVVSVDYRLAPEHLYPAAVVDSYAVVCWVAENQRQLNGNGKIGVAGESAGGTIAAVMSQMARDENGPTIAFQCLLYPVIDHDLGRESYALNGAGYLLETATMKWFWDTYCPDEAARKHPSASPIRAESLADLAPALIMTAEFDPLRDEGEAYGAALNAAGGTAEVVRCEGLVHDFLSTAAVFECSRAPFLSAVEKLKSHLN